MYLKTLHIAHFRNISSADLALSPGLNYFHGDNGAGKTALLEAVYMLARGRSFRTAKATTLIDHAADGLLLRATLEGEGEFGHTLAMSKDRSGQTALRIDGEKERRISETARLLPVQVLLPSAADLVLAGPADRRSFLDWGLFHVEPQFLDVSRRYRRVLSQRNAWLKTALDSETPQTDPWFEQLCGLSADMSDMRQRYLDNFQPAFADALARLAPELEVTLALDWGGLASAAEIEKKLSDSFSRDVKFGVTHRGPHRADLLFVTGGRVAAEIVSRGQAKLIASAALLAQAEHLYAVRQQKSVFLIDDFGAELDAGHWRQFTATLVALGCQILATSTTPLDAAVRAQTDAIRVFHVKHGSIDPISD